LKDKSDALLIMLDKIEDPHNLGSIIRTSAAAGADGVIIPKRHSSPITSSVEKASAGTTELVKISRITNLSQTIKKLKENNFWIIGAEASSSKNFFEEDYNMKCVIVIGGENQGISLLVKENCDILVKIPMLKNVNSLNAANAASILIYEIVRQRILKKQK
jgi:23S rRNA (guanosine2251-2'-O)-methyltransferase